MDNRCGDPGHATLQQQLTDTTRTRPDDIASALPEPIGMALTPGAPAAAER
jgi:hypothetical protein